MTRARLLEKRYEQLAETLANSGYRVSEARQIAFGMQFRVATEEWSGLVRLYCNRQHKITLDLSQVRPQEQRHELEKLLAPTPEEAPPSPLEDEELPAIGTDESGKGDYFGPLVTAGVYVDTRTARKLRQARVMDSKRLSDKKNRLLAETIMSICRDRFAIVELSPPRYNDLYRQFKHEGKNLNTLLGWQHARVLENILTHTSCELAIIDQFADKKVVLGRLQKRGRQLQVTQRPRAEDHVAVAAASVLARARFLRRLEELSTSCGLTLPKGSSKLVVAAAQKLLTKHGPSILEQVAKTHFKITHRLKK